jgi:hypothetical protein
VPALPARRAGAIASWAQEAGAAAAVVAAHGVDPAPAAGPAGAAGAAEPSGTGGAVRPWTAVHAQATVTAAATPAGGGEEDPRGREHEGSSTPGAGAARDGVAASAPDDHIEGRETADRDPGHEMNAARSRVRAPHPRSAASRAAFGGDEQRGGAWRYGVGLESACGGESLGGAVDASRRRRRLGEQDERSCDETGACDPAAIRLRHGVPPSRASSRGILL